MFDRLSSEGESPAAVGNLVVAAKKLAIRLPSLPLNDFRDLIGSFLRRIIIQESGVEIVIER
jgi:hypothetical protein